MRQKIMASIKRTSIAVVLAAGIAGHASAQARAALTRDIDRATAQPVNGSCLASGVNPGLTKCILYTVPSGKRLVVELVSFLLASDTNQSITQILVGKSDPNAVNILIGTGVYELAVPTPIAQSATSLYAGTQSLRFYMDEGDLLAGQMYYTGGSNYQQAFSFSGYLVDK